MVAKDAFLLVIKLVKFTFQDLCEGTL